tara:strand:+ start:4564 stop:5220 length:657 start_codon:yes stop_codon:yes gene_type:complete
MAGFSIEGFKGVVERNGYAKPNRFFVSFVPPLGIVGASEFRDKIEYYCEGVNLPGFHLQTSDHRRFTYGPTEKRPFAPHTNPLQMTITADGAGQVWKFFHSWMNYIMPHSVKDGIRKEVDPDIAVPSNATLSIPNALPSVFPYELEYKQNYVTDVAIYHVPETWEGGEAFESFISRTICIDCFPSMVSDMQMNWQDNNNISRFQVQMEYLDWHNVKNL